MSQKSRSPGQEAAGGVGEAGTYIGRRADLELPDALRKGEYCWVVGPRQIGKTSLFQRVSRRLANEGTLCAFVDLNTFQGAEDADGWYFALADQLARDLDCPAPLEWWDRPKSQKLPASERWSGFVREVLVAGREQPVAIFLDEVQTTHSIASRRLGFLAVLRSLHAGRGKDEVLRRLTFCLASVVTPEDLVDDPLEASASFGRHVQLEDFSRQEVSLLRGSLAATGVDVEKLLDLVYAKTNGHPYMTMRLAAALAKTKLAADKVAPAVERLIDEIFIAKPSEHPCLAYAAKRFAYRPRDRANAGPGAKMEIYRRILESGGVTVKSDDPVQLELQLAGLVRATSGEQGQLVCPRNAIFARVFDDAWLRAQSHGRFLSDAMWQWQDNARSPEALLRGPVLQRAIEWARANQLAADEREFLDLSLRAEHAQVEAETRNKKRHVRQLALLASLLVVAVGAGVVTYSQAELKVAREREEIALKAQHEAEQARAALEARAKDAEAQTATAQAEMQRATAAAEEARRLARDAAAQVAAAKRGVAAAQKQRVEAMVAAERANRDAEQAERKARMTVEASEAERAELMQQAKELGAVGEGAGKLPLKDVLAEVQKRTAHMAKKIGRLESEIQPLAGENLALATCRLLVEAGRGEGHELYRMQAELARNGVAVELGQLVSTLIDLNRAGALCPGNTRWDDVRSLAASRLGHK
ncbi:MAG: AAA-like domain-containing protein [Deltaproteobacteria bacterium]|nr:AAA-like domain-containing protein [Deltaproteobacteria bacterium]